MTRLFRFIVPLVLCAQGPSGAPLDGLPVRVVDLSQAIPLVGMPPSPIQGLPHCSSSGDIYLDIYGVPDASGEVRTFPDLYRVSPQHEVKRIPRLTPTDYKQIVARGFFAGEHTLVSLIQAFQPTAKPEDRSGRQDHFFLSVTDRDGDHARLISLSLSFDPSQVAVFDSGPFVVIGMDNKTRRAVAALLRDDGSFSRTLDLDAERKQATTPGDASNEHAREEFRSLARSMAAAQFVPWGTDIVLVRPESGLPIYRIRASGAIDVFGPRIPDGYQLEGMLGSGGRDTWVLRVRSMSDVKAFEKTHKMENPDEHLLEVNPANGEVLRELDVRGPAPGEVACGADGKLSVVYFGGKETTEGQDQLTFASAFR